ncbi:MAG TPA: heavy-metal-associated domain-containing protein [Longimicrobiales bacterium]|nr:heavy-metal-associated domain-containing protein [Longimicrobiales bacterium]
MPTVVIGVAGLRDDADKSRLEAALRTEPGVLGAVVDRTNARAEVEFEDDAVEIARLLRIVEEAGFTASLRG